MKKALTSEWTRAFTWAVNFTDVQQQLADLQGHYKHRRGISSSRRGSRSPSS